MPPFDIDIYSLLPIIINKCDRQYCLYKNKKKYYVELGVFFVEYLTLRKEDTVMATLRLNVSENASLEAALEKMEALFGSEYSFEPEMSEFSCRCSGPAQSCTWH